MKKEKNATLITFALSWVGKKNKKALDKAAKNCEKSAEKTLRGILEYAKDSEWGKAHHFSEILEAKSADELYERWQKNVPIQDYEDLRPYIERHKNGEENVLFPGKPMMYATTSGTTNGSPSPTNTTKTFLAKCQSFGFTHSLCTGPRPFGESAFPS